jgi:hypothetical protein
MVVHGEGTLTESLSSCSSSVSSSVSSLEDQDSEELPTTTDLEYAVSDITNIITCLYKLSTTLRNPAPRDRIQKSAAIGVSHYEHFDVQHAAQKFPGIPQYLSQRMGRANTKRRQLLRYYQKHHDKMSRYVDHPKAAHWQGESVGISRDRSEPELERMEHTLITTRTTATATNSQTTVTTLKITQEAIDEIQVDAEWEAGRSQTSFATSVAEDGQIKFRVPPPPEGNSSFDGTPFECPYCYMFTAVKSSYAWVYVMCKSHPHILAADPMWAGDTSFRTCVLTSAPSRIVLRQIIFSSAGTTGTSTKCKPIAVNGFVMLVIKYSPPRFGCWST